MTELEMQIIQAMRQLNSENTAKALVLLSEMLKSGKGAA